MNTRVFPIVVLACCLGFFGCAAHRSSDPDRDGLRAHALVKRATETLRVCLNGDRGEELRRLLPRARGVLIVPNMGSAGFLFSVDTGNGVLLYRNGGRWTGPVFLTEASGGFGAQAGFTNTSGVFLYTDEADVRYLLETGGVFQGRAGVTVFNTNLKGKDTPKFNGTGSVFFIGDTSGLYAGAGVHGGGLISREHLNSAYYGFEGDPLSLLFKGGPAPEDGLALRKLLADTLEQTEKTQKKDGAETPSN